jgi:hypothetical protein
MSLLDHVPTALKCNLHLVHVSGGRARGLPARRGADPTGLLVPSPRRLHIGTTRALEMKSVTL